MTPKKHKLDIFKVLDRIKNKDRNFYRNLTEEERKAYIPLITMRWLTGVKSAFQIILLNELLNPFIFQFGTKSERGNTHPELLYQLSVCCSVSNPPRYHWNKALSKRHSSTPKTISVLKEYLGYNSMDAAEVLPVLDDETIISYAEQLGRQPEDMKAIMKELKSRGLN